MELKVESMDFLMYSSDSSINDSVDSSSPLSVSTYIFGKDCREPLFFEKELSEICKIKVKVLKQ